MIATFPEQVAHLLKRAILKGELRPGTRLVPDCLAQEFQTPRSVICEGLRQLQEAGLVVYDGCLPIVADLEEVFDLRVLLETEALRLAIPNHNQTLWQDCENMLDEIEALPDSSAWLDQNWQWHRMLYAPAQRPKLLAMIESLHSCNSCVNRVDEAFRQRLQVEHRSILQACREKDVVLACSQLIEHINQHRRELLNALDR